MKIPTYILIALLALMNLIWSGSSAVIKYYIVLIEPVSLLFWRFAFALVAMLVWALAARVSLKIDRRTAVSVLVAGALLGASNFFWATGIDLGRASDASLLFVFEPIWGIILAGIVLKEKIRASAVLGLVIVIAGLFVLSNFNFSAFGFEKGGMALGNILIVISLMCEGTFSVVLKPISTRVHPVFAMILVLIVAEIVIGLTCVAKGNFMFPTAESMPAIIYLSLICTVMGYTLWVFVMKSVPVNAMLFTIFIQPVAGPFIAYLLLGEKIDPRFLLGGAILLAGMSVAVFGGIRKKKMIESELIPLAGEL